MIPSRPIAVVGAGAIGGILAARLARRGHRVGVVARGAHLDAIRRHGLRAALPAPAGGERWTAEVSATDRPDDLGPCGTVFLTVKAHGLAAALAGSTVLIGSETIVVPVLNGIPWWYFQGVEGAFRDQPVRAVDPEGVLLRRFRGHALVGCVTHSAAEVTEPGTVALTKDGPFLLGAVDPAHLPAAASVTSLLAEAGFQAKPVADIRAEIWLKLAGNAAFNPVGALTGARFAGICDDEGLLAVIRAAMRECMGVGERHGIAFPIGVEERIAMARTVGSAKSSMLQDLERGRPVESGAILAAVSELGRRVGLATPTIDMLTALVEARSRHPLGGR